MQLRIHYHRGKVGTPPSNHVIANFADLDALAREVTADVKTWAKAVPLRKQRATLTVWLNAEWVEPVKPKKRK
jgi:hypothetical protein